MDSDSPASPATLEKVRNLGRFDTMCFARWSRVPSRSIKAGWDISPDALPESDGELGEWLERRLATDDDIAFDDIIWAAAMKDRKLKTSLVPDGAALITEPLRRSWIAWHMEGDVTDGLVKAAGNGGMSRPDRAQMLFYAAAWGFWE